jgi:hypothetical protein
MHWACASMSSEENNCHINYLYKRQAGDVTKDPLVQEVEAALRKTLEDGLGLHQLEVQGIVQSKSTKVTTPILRDVLSKHFRTTLHLDRMIRDVRTNGCLCRPGGRLSRSSPSLTRDPF